MIEPPQTILYATVDSLRKDAVTPEKMPHVAELADEGIWFEQMVSCAPATAASFVALMASRYYSDVDGIGLPDREFTTLAESLPADYHRGGHSTNQFTSAFYNYDRGFDAFGSPSQGWKFAIRKHLDEEGALFNALEWGYHQYLRVRADNGGSPTRFNPTAEAVHDVLDAQRPVDGREFLWAHYMDPHHPYEPPDEYLPESVESRGEAQRISRELPGRVPDGRMADLRRCRDLYHAECRSFDDAFGEWHATLPEDTLVVLVGDHGELLGEHGRLGHPHEMWEELINVPCLMYHPDLPSMTVDTLQTTLDLPPTITDLAGGVVPRSMRGSPINPKTPGRDRVFGTIETPENVGFARSADYKWVRHLSRRSTQDDHGELLFSLTAPERLNIGREYADRYGGTVEDLRDSFEDAVGSEPVATGHQFGDGQVKRHMADLGYLQQQ